MPTENIIARIRQGDRQCIAEVYQTYRIPFIVWIRKTYSNAEDEAMELYQTAIHIFCDNILTGKIQSLNSSLKTYLFGIGKNKWHEMNRYQQKIRHPEDFKQYFLIDDSWENLMDDDRSQFKLLTKGLQTLGDPCRRLLEAFYYQKLSWEEIYRELGYKNTDSAKNKKYKCLKKITSDHG